MLCIANRRANGTTRPHTRGTVFDRDGRVLGRVGQTQRRLRGGDTGTAWTPVVILDGREVAALGTRHPDRWSAARALRAFWQHIEAGNLDLCRRPEDGRWAGDLTGDDLRIYLDRRALSRAVAYFKYDRHDVCALLARYRGADPRRDDTAPLPPVTDHVAVAA